MPHDTVNVADFAALECKAAVKSVAVCAMREKQQNLWGRDKNVSASLSEQECIVGILDRFDALCNDLSSGLPAEIEARQKQYEYYRDRLLNFEPITK